MLSLARLDRFEEIQWARFDLKARPVILCIFHISSPGLNFRLNGAAATVIRVTSYYTRRSRIWTMPHSCLPFSQTVAEVVLSKQINDTVALLRIVLA